MFRYYLTNRPPGIGCQPSGYINSEVWMPSELIDELKPEERYAFGWVEYDTALTLQAIYDYQLLPADIVERVSNWLWQDFDKDAQRAIAWIELSIDRYRDKWQEYRLRDWRLHRLLQVEEAGRSVDDVIEQLDCEE